MYQDQQVVISRLERVLADFLRAYAVKRLDRMSAENHVNRLREITFSNKAEYNQPDNRIKALESWFADYSPELPKNLLNNELIQQIIDCVNQINLLCRGEYDGSAGEPALFDRKRAQKLANLANSFLDEATGKEIPKVSNPAIKLNRAEESEIPPPEPNILSGDNSKEKFMDSLRYQLSTLEHYRDEKYHLFSIVDQLLKKLEQKPDIKTNHLAASILYFLKMSGYLVTPYVERLRQVTRNQNGR